MISLNLTLLIMMGLLLVLAVILNRLIFRPMTALLDERERKIKDPGSDAKRMEIDAETMRNEYNTAYNQAKIKALEERNKLRKEGADREQVMIKEAYAAAEKIISEVKAGVEKETSAARESLRTEVKSISDSVTQKLLGRAL